MKTNSKRLVMVICAVLTCVVTALTVIGLTACSKWWKELPENARKFDYLAWNLEFNDDFDGTELNTDYWSIKTFEDNAHIRRAGIYVDDSDIVYLKNSNLVISTKYKSSEYGEGWHTGWVDSSVPKDDPNKGYETKHGYFEIRCIVPPSVGIWSAFWMMPTASGVGMSENDILGTGKDGIEIDIMESPYMYQKGEKSLVTHVVHGDGYNGTTVSDKSPTYRVNDMYNTFHTYGVEWNESEYIFYVDGSETWRTKHSDGKGGFLGVSDELEHMILSVEVAGTKDKNSDKLIPGKVYNDKGELEDFWCGNPDENDKTKSYDFIIDYVRVYKAK